MVNALSNFVNNPAEEIHKIERKHKHANKNAKGVELNTKIEFANLNDDLILYECLCGHRS